MKAFQERSKLCLSLSQFKKAVGLFLLMFSCMLHIDAIAVTQPEKSEPQKTAAVPAKPDSAPSQTPVKTEDRYKTVSTADQERDIFNYLSRSLKGKDIAYWPEETNAEGAASKVLLIESPYLSYKEHGNAVILAAPGTYPYQARWYPELRDQLTHRGWNILSLGLQPHPFTIAIPDRASYSKMTNDELKLFETETEKQKQTSNETWLNQAKARTQLLVSFASDRKVPMNILIAEGLSAYVAGLAAAGSSTQLTGLVLIDLQSPSKKAQQELEENLTTQGPILDIIFSSNLKNRAAAIRRKQSAIKAENKDYRVEFAPAGLKFDNSATPWLAALIHGWAMKNSLKKEQH